MAKTYSIILDTNADINFPQKCVVCRKPYHGTLTLLDDLPDGGIDPESVQVGQYKKTRVPIHTTCSAKLNTNLYARWMIPLSIGIVIWLVAEIKYNFDFGRIFILITFLGLFMLWTKMAPKPFEIDTEGDKLVFNFKSKEYAQKFAAMNNVSADF